MEAKIPENPSASNSKIGQSFATVGSACTTAMTESHHYLANKIKENLPGSDSRIAQNLTAATTAMTESHHYLSNKIKENLPASDSRIAQNLTAATTAITESHHYVSNKIKENLPASDSRIAQHLNDATTAISSSKYAKDALAAASGSGTAMVVATKVLLPAVGFGANGIVGGSTAASWMASYGGFVSSGSTFAALQSAGVVGLGIVPLGGIALGGGALAFSCYRFAKSTKSRL